MNTNFYKLFEHIKTTLDIIINTHFNIKKKQSVFFEFVDVPETVIKFILNHFINNDIYVFYNNKFQEIFNDCALNYDDCYYKKMAEIELGILKKMDFFIGIRMTNDIHGFSQVDIHNKEKMLKNYIRPVHYEFRNNNLKWLYLRLPSPAFAKIAGMSEDHFSEYFYSSVNIDYNKLEKLLEPLKDLLLETSIIKIQNKNTDISFCIEKMPVICDVGQHNLPDGEVRTVPVKDSVNGNIQFNIPSVYYGHYFSDIELVFKNGKVIEAKCKDGQNELNEILNLDEGAKYTGEFAIGVNPFINCPINDILFDEKIHGSIHFALGNAYPACDNENRSCIHWDLILDLNQSKGGGKIYFDDQMILKNGGFIPSSLRHINKTELKLKLEK